MDSLIFKKWIFSDFKKMEFINSKLVQQEMLKRVYQTEMKDDQTATQSHLKKEKTLVKVATEINIKASIFWVYISFLSPMQFKIKA